MGSEVKPLAVRGREALAGAVAWVTSVPVFVKVMGIGALVALVFGAMTFFQGRAGLRPLLRGFIEERALAAARTLADACREPLLTGDRFALQDAVRQARTLFPDLRYVIVQDRRGVVLAHSFEHRVPPDLLRVRGSEPVAGGELKLLSSAEGYIFDAAHPVLAGDAGTVRLGMTDRTIRSELARLTRAVLWRLAACVLIGTGLAVWLTRALTRPIQELADAAERVGRGDFSAKAAVHSADEIGQLAVAFNRMTAGLERYRRQVQEKEAVRQHLLERLVQAQEDERRSIARELHDQLGQSLLALLLAIRSRCGRSGLPVPACREMEGKVRALIEEVRLLAWGMRPSVLDDYGLDSALRRYVERMTRQTGLEIDYEYSGPPAEARLPGRTEVTLYRVAQEALTNVVRHAGAKRASVVNSAAPAT